MGGQTTPHLVINVKSDPYGFRSKFKHSNKYIQKIHVVCGLCEHGARGVTHGSSRLHTTSHVTPVTSNTLARDSKAVVASCDSHGFRNVDRGWQRKRRYYLNTRDYCAMPTTRPTYEKWRSLAQSTLFRPRRAASVLVPTAPRPQRRGPWAWACRPAGARRAHAGWPAGGRC